MQIIFLGGTIASIDNGNGQLAPKLNLENLLQLIEKTAFKKADLKSQDFPTHCPYIQDSQDFDLNKNGSLVIEELNQYPDDDILIITGTDNKKWLVKLVVSHNLINNRKIVFLSSMYDPQSQPLHVGHLFLATLNFLQQENIANSAYIIAAQNIDATEINIYNARSKITKISCKNHGAIIGQALSYQVTIGNEIIFTKINNDNNFQVQDQNLIDFIASGKMKLLPLLPNNLPENIKKYYQNLHENDIAVIEICQLDIEKTDFQDIILQLANQGIKIILFNRSYFNKDENIFTPLIKLESLVSFQEKINHKNICITSLNSNFYGLIAYGTPDSFQFNSENIQNPSNLALRYIPNSIIFTNSSNFMQNCPIILESLAGGVMPRSLLQPFYDDKIPLNLALHPTYAQEESIAQSSYAASANAKFLQQINSTSHPQISAINATLQDKTIPETHTQVPTIADMVSHKSVSS